MSIPILLFKANPSSPVEFKARFMKRIKTDGSRLSARDAALYTKPRLMINIKLFLTCLSNQ